MSRPQKENPVFIHENFLKGTEFLPQTQIFLSLYLGNPMS